MTNDELNMLDDEVRRLRLETSKFDNERAKLMAERKLNFEKRFLIPWEGAMVIGAVAAGIFFFLGIMTFWSVVFRILR